MARSTFPSLASPEIRYAIYNSWQSWQASDSGICVYVREFDTLGDGEIQHSPDCLVPRERLWDFLESFIAAVSRDDSWEEFCEWWPAIVDESAAAETILFAKSLKYDEAKPWRYYNLDERKVSSAESKRHDKRWSAIETWHDGTPQSAMSITVGIKPSGIIGHYLWVILMGKTLNMTPSQEMALINKAEYKSHMAITSAIKLIDRLMAHSVGMKRAKQSVIRHIEHVEWQKSQETELAIT